MTPANISISELDRESAAIRLLINSAVKKEKLEILNWAMKLCGHGMTTGMIRKLLHNKFVEISGEGQKA